MTGSSAPKVTRSSLVRLSRRLEQVDKGAALLHKRRDALVLQLFARVRPGVDARRRIGQQATLAYAALVDALAAASRSDLAAIAWPSRELRAELPAPAPSAAASSSVAPAATGGPAVPPKLLRELAARALLPGQFAPAVEKAAQAFEQLLQAVLEAAPEEFALRTLGRALAHTTRQVNVLEQRVAMQLASALLQVRRTLDEREREEAVRLRRIAARARRRASA